MRPRSLYLATLGLLLGIAVVAAAPAAGTAETKQYVVVFAGESIPAAADGTVAAAGGTIVRKLPKVGVAIVSSAKADFAARLRSTRGVLAVGSQRALSLPPAAAFRPTTAVTPGALWGLQWNIRRVRADQAWYTTTGSHDTVVAVIDTGVATNHPDLAGNIVHTACYSSLPTCSTYPDLHWHGTHVAGIAAATGTVGVLGVGPNLGIASYNVFEIIPDCGICAWEGPTWAAMMDAADRGFKVINMSLGDLLVFPTNPDHVAMWTAWNRVAGYVNRRGTTMVAAPGNADLDLNGPWKAVPSDLPDVISVAATGIRPDPEYPQAGAYDVRAFYSNMGAAVTLAAPGGDCGLDDGCDPARRPPNAAQYLVLSSFVFADPTCAVTQTCTVGWAFAAGTSMAAPHVAGVAGLLTEIKPRLGPGQVEATLKRTAERLRDRQLFGHGMVNAYDAVRG